MPAINMTMTGEILRKATSKAAIAEMSVTCHAKFFFCSIRTNDTAISATTAGRNPLKIRVITSLSRIPEKNMAIRSITVNEGMTTPVTDARTPFIPHNL